MKTSSKLIKLPPTDSIISVILVTQNDENLIEEVKLIDQFEDDAKFGADKKSYTFRIIYRSPERTLTNEEINKIQEEIREKTKTDLSVVLR